MSIGGEAGSQSGPAAAATENAAAANHRPRNPATTGITSGSSVANTTFASPLPSPPCGAAFLRRLHTDPSATHVTLPTTMSAVPVPNDLGARAGSSGTILHQNSFPPSPLLPSPPSLSHIPSPAISSPSEPPLRPMPKPLQQSDETDCSQVNSSFSDSPSPNLPSIPLSSPLSPRYSPRSSAVPLPDGVALGASVSQPNMPKRNEEAQRSSSFQERVDQRAAATDVRSMPVGGDRAASFTVNSEPAHELNAEPDSRRASWNDFAVAYCNGRFDPLRIPNPPNFESPMKDRISLPCAPSSAPNLRSVPFIEFHGSRSGPASVASEMPSMPQRASFELDTSPTRQRSRPPRISMPEYNVAAATVRIASSSIPDSVLAPLAVPSPERELLDPLASVCSPGALPSSHSKPGSPAPDAPSSRWSSRSRSSGLLSAEGLPTIEGSPTNTPTMDQKTTAMTAAMASLCCNPIAIAADPEPVASAPAATVREPVPVAQSQLAGGAVKALSAKLPPASAPLPRQEKEDDCDDDYFGDVPPTTEINEPSSPIPVPSVHAYPLVHHPHELRPFYEKYGFLPAPMPPREADRRKALYNYNIMHTAGDLNFDRIVHMVKLVFNTRIVFLSLIDSDQQWYKSQTGFGGTHSPRTTGLCGHCLLVDSDEPFVVLDTHLDWRFRNNPHVTGIPFIRFYAGTPLRTADGLNLGSLCLVDDTPRTEFTPRSRHILKEFAAIVMRELELWRDKLQLRTRDKIQTSMEKFTRECLEIDDKLSSTNFEASSRMTQVYQRAAKLVYQTLDLDGCAILDISQFERVEVDLPNGAHKVVYHANPYHESQSVLERVQSFGTVAAFPVLASTPGEVRTRDLTPLEHERMSMFLGDQRDGRIFENIAPSWIRYIFPPSLKYGMVVPVIGIDGQPFALICAHTHDKGKQFLEGYELQFLRAIGVIILSAVLRRRMILADRSKSVLISSVSHELRTPLHGILAATELLNDSPLDTNQSAFLSTVKTCGMQLIETVNHVLDFTKLRSEKDNGGRRTAHLTQVDLAELIEQTVESCYVGQRSRYMQLNDDQLGSFYSPVPMGRSPYDQRANIRNQQFASVESVVDIGLRPKGWKVLVDTGSIRRIVMNLYGNSLKFTKDGFVQVSLRELPHPPDATRIPVELTVVDTGKGIGKSFLKDQLFEPFTQENPLQPGTGLGLAIVNSIVRSDVVQGNVDVWSAEGVGTEIKVSCEVELAVPPDAATNVPEYHLGAGFKVAFLGFDVHHRGLALVREVVGAYATFMGLVIVDDPADADLLVVNEFVKQETEDNFGNKALILVATFKKSDAEILSAMGRTGYTGLMHKPVAAAKVMKEIKAAIKWLKYPSRANSGLSALSSTMSSESDGLGLGLGQPSTPDGSVDGATSPTTPSRGKVELIVPLHRRRSDERHLNLVNARPPLAPRGLTYHSVTSPTPDQGASIVSSPTAVGSGMTTISLADGGAMLKAAARPELSSLHRRAARVMVVEDNVINRRVLTAFLKKRGFEHAEAVNGADGVELFDKTPPNYWDVLLMDITMPVMNGYEATRSIRRIESSRRKASAERISQAILAGDEKVSAARSQSIGSTAKIFALTGLATDSDKRQAFDSGVDGYLVKPVSLASLDLLFTKIGF